MYICLSRNSYFYWLRIIREEALEQSAESGFVELSLPAETDSGSHQITAVPIAKPEPSQLTLSVCGITIPSQLRLFAKGKEVSRGRSLPWKSVKGDLRVGTDQLLPPVDLIPGALAHLVRVRHTLHHMLLYSYHKPFKTTYTIITDLAKILLAFSR